MNTKPPVPLLLVLAFGLMVMLVAGCGGQKAMPPVAVGEMEEYRDPGIGFSINHPKGWVLDAQVGRVRFFNAPDVDKKFLEPTGAYPIGVTITVDVTATSDVAAAARQFRSDLGTTGMQLAQEQSVMVSGVEATKIPYTANFGGGNIVKGHHVLLGVDSALYDIGFAGFGETYAAYAAVFDTVLASFRLPAPKVAGRDETLPSDVMTEFDAKSFTFQYPDNFNFTNPPKGKFEQTIELRGQRLDCSIRFDIFGAKGLTVDKVFEQNKATYKGRAAQTAKVGGENALMVNYPSRSDVESRAYFVVKNDKVLRVTMNWFKPQSESYVPVYEKVINSIRFK